MEAIYHIPAMLQETIEGLAVKPGGVYVDVTFGGGGHSRAILERMDANVQRDDIQCTKESRILSGGTDEASNGGNNAAEQNNETSNGGNNAAERDKEENKEGHLYSFDQDIEAYENAINNPTPGSSTDGHRQSDRAELFTRSREGVGSKNGEVPTLADNPNWTFVHSNFRYLRNWMDYYGVKEIDGLLADLGVSFHHFDCPERGFSFRFSAPLDMRMNQTAKRTAADIINTYSEEDLARIFWLYGEMKNGRGIARNICKARSLKPILRTEELIEAAFKLKVESLKLKEVEELRVHPLPNPPHEGEGCRITSGTTDKTINGGKNAAEQDKERDSAECRREQDKEKGAGLKTREQDKEDGNPPSMADTRELEIPAQYKKDLARLFQALRIEVNDEMGALREMLVAARDLLKPGGRIAILTYHSLEDRLVKNFLRSGNLEGNIEKDFYGNAITPFDVIEKGLTASDDEVERNPRSRSAKLRVGRKK